MCGILAAHGLEKPASDRARLIACSKRIRHRGPDWSGCYVGKQTVLVHERLAIVGVGAYIFAVLLELYSDDGKIILAVNGEIYNHVKLRSSLKQPFQFKTHSDCEVIIPLYKEHSDLKELCNLLDGMFSFVLLDESVTPPRVIAARDPIGITTLYQGWDSKRPGAVFFASELKAIIDECDKIISFPPGHVYDSQDQSTVRYFQPSWWDGDLDYAHAEARARKIAEAQSGPPSPAPGGISAIEYATLTSWPQLHSFSIGLENSPDLLAARKAAHYPEHGSPRIRLHRARRVGCNPRSRKIKAMGVKMVLSGEGSDEVFGGYLYFHAAPDATAFHQESVKRVKNLHTADCLRANKSTMAWGLEARVPFLDKAFLEVAMNVDPKEKMFSKGSQQQYDADGRPRMEKPYLPDSILWRQKEQFSDGVGYSWIDGIKDHAAQVVSDEDFAKRSERWPEDSPDTKEAYFIRDIFDGLFPSEAAAKTAVRWIPRGDWGCSSDPSGRSVSIHNAAYTADE
ncbi:hypothetical protein NLI96_g6380 [Meripilus lineatus]|uniref:asparagine synthase (glutamine-hydrolyzing) n=1 Tax=Meripilus lineatus TaxID=2056292 RepID=A0AAD5V5Y0_9APHY|nr:hypothetical protein NLI96_g6380 [Physisporinus lineatus]